MTRRGSFLVILAATVAVGIPFFQVVRPFLAPLFVAVVVAVLLHPAYQRTVSFTGGRHRAAAVVTVLAVLVVLMPLGATIYFAGRELGEVGSDFAQLDLEQQPSLKRVVLWARRNVPPSRWDDMQRAMQNGVQTLTAGIVSRTQAVFSGLAGFAVGFAIMAVALYYFLWQGPQIRRQLRQLSPFDPDEEQFLLNDFVGVCRGVFWGTLVCAIAQALLMGLGLLVLGVERWLLLSLLTLVASFVPFIGAAAVWIPISLWLLWQGSYGSALFFMIYGAAVVSTADNVVRVYILNGAARMHPLLALVSVLGGISLAGLWGIFLGPTIAATFYALLRVLRSRLDPQRAELPTTATEEVDGPKSHPPRSSPARSVAAR